MTGANSTVAPAADPVDGVVQRRIRALDGWRALSIFCVVTVHLLNAKYDMSSQFLKYISVLGVQVFFVISGFLITTLALHEKHTTGRFSAGDFYLRRAFRILPAFYTFIIVLNLLAMSGVLKEELGGRGAAAAFACNIFTCQWYIGHTWSLAFEQQFYLFFPLLFHGTRTGAKFGFVFFSLVLLVLLLSGSHVLMNLAFQFAYIACGAMLACCSGRLLRVRARAARRLSAAALTVCVVLIATRGPGRFAVYFGSPWAQATEALLMPIALSWLIHRTATGDGLVTRLFETGPIRFVGRLSYSIYLWQQLFTGAWAPKDSIWFSAWMLIPAAVASYYLVERPALRLGASLMARSRARRSQAS